MKFVLDISLALISSTMSMYGFIDFLSLWPLHVITTLGGIPLESALTMNVDVTIYIEKRLTNSHIDSSRSHSI